LPASGSTASTTKSAEIEFLKPGRGTVSAHFRLTGEMLDKIRSNTTADGSKYLPRYHVDITDAEDQTVARGVQDAAYPPQIGHPPRDRRLTRRRTHHAISGLRLWQPASSLHLYKIY
jgi:uncharacterized protein (DUF1684 family)